MKTYDKMTEAYLKQHGLRMMRYKDAATREWRVKYVPTTEVHKHFRVK